MSKHSTGELAITGRTGYTGKHEKVCEYTTRRFYPCGERASYQSERHNDVLCLNHANDVVRETGEPVRPL